MLIILGGLPGTGKTTIARIVAEWWGATHLRLDTIEQAMRDALPPGTGIGPAGYAVAQAIAAENLAAGRRIVADCVNPVRASRQGWRAVAARAGARLLDIEVICSDAAEHERRVRTRPTDVPGLALPDWAQVLASPYEAREDERLVLDTADLSATAAAATIMAVIG